VDRAAPFKASSNPRANKEEAFNALRLGIHFKVGGSFRLYRKSALKTATHSRVQSLSIAKEKAVQADTGEKEADIVS
jgi:hypothetical protein